MAGGDPVCLVGDCGLLDLLNQGVQGAHKFAVPDAETQVVEMFHIFNSLNSAGAIKMQMCFWSANSNAQESQGFIFLNCPNRQVPVGFFFTTEDGKTQFKSIRNLTRLDHCEAQ